jgi:predicted DNA-binding transcriptional regulator YafY
MKIDRLLGITTYLLNNEHASAKLLSERFEVSIRTINRDIDILNMAGIPITTLFGPKGGYQILNSFKLNNQIVDDDSYNYIVTALKGLDTAYADMKLKNTLDKMESLSHSFHNNSNLILDFSLALEGNIDNEIKIIETAIQKKRQISFDYTNSYNETNTKQVEPIVLIYKWYAWYLLGYCLKHGDYRLYKLIRIRNLNLLNQSFEMEHKPAKLILDEYEKLNSEKNINIVLKCKKEIKIQVEEYLKGSIIAEDEDYFKLAMNVPVYERMWFSLLLGFGNDIEIIEPNDLRLRLVNHINKMSEIYN